jgi:hypothetical protein
MRQIRFSDYRPSHAENPSLQKLEEPDHIARGNELILLRAVIAGSIVVSPLKADFRPEHHAASDPVIPRNHVFGIEGLVAGALALDVVEIFITDRYGIVLPELALHVIRDRPLRSEAGLLARRAPGAVSAGLSRDRSKYAGNVLLVLIPGFRIEMPVLVDLVIPGQVVSGLL